MLSSKARNFTLDPIKSGVVIFVLLVSTELEVRHQTQLKMRSTWTWPYCCLMPAESSLLFVGLVHAL
jgi:hypothetical protein